MTEIYSVAPTTTVDQVTLTKVWTQGTSGLSQGYTNLVPIQLGEEAILLAFDKETQEVDTYALTPAAPWVKALPAKTKLPNGPWDRLGAFTLGNAQYVYTYRSDTGGFGFFAVHNDLSLSDPYIFAPSHTTPSAGFTSVAPYTSLGQQYLLGYDFDTGRVENIVVKVVPSSIGNAPPLAAQNVWFHLWAKGWTHFAMFQLGGANFFFKINTDKLNVNIDHMQDDPSQGSIEVGSQLQSQLPDAESINAAAIIPWSAGTPYLVTYIATSGQTEVYAIRADCLGWIKQVSAAAETNATAIVPYRIGETSYVLFYGGTSQQPTALARRPKVKPAKAVAKVKTRATPKAKTKAKSRRAIRRKSP